MSSTSNAHRLCWQRAAHDAVGVFLADAARLNLPAITWIVATSGAITGRVDVLGSGPDGQRATFNAWVGYLGVAPRVQTRRDGTVTLHARFERSDLVGGAIRADIDPPDDVEDGV